jgi:hypothetical protein
VAFCRERGLARVFLWTAAGLDAALTLYRGAGFVLVEEAANTEWAERQVTEQRYVLDLDTAPPANRS